MDWTLKKVRLSSYEKMVMKDSPQSNVYKALFVLPDPDFPDQSDKYLFYINNPEQGFNVGKVYDVKFTIRLDEMPKVSPKTGRAYNSQQMKVKFLSAIELSK